MNWSKKLIRFDEVDNNTRRVEIVGRKPNETGYVKAIVSNKTVWINIPGLMMSAQEFHEFTNEVLDAAHLCGGVILEKPGAVDDLERKGLEK